MKPVIAYIVDQYAMARGSCDIEYVVAHMCNGQRKTFEAEDCDDFFEDPEEYWRKNGWEKFVNEKGWGLRPIAPERKG